jgi:hypothetical protein
MINLLPTTTNHLYELVDMAALEERDRTWGAELLLADETPSLTIIDGDKPVAIAACVFNAHFGEYELGLILGDAAIVSPRAILEGVQKALAAYKGNEQGYCISLCDPRFPKHSSFLKHLGLQYRENVLLHNVTLEVWVLHGWWYNSSPDSSRHSRSPCRR